MQQLLRLWLLALVLPLVSGCVVGRALVCTDTFTAGSFHDFCCPDCVTERELAQQLHASRRAPMLGPAEPAATQASSRGRLKVHTSFAGGRLLVLGRPARDASRVILVVRPLATLGVAPCSARLFRDAAPIVVHEVARASDHEVRVLIDASALRGLNESERFAGEACGRPFELDARGREALGLFEVRFRERIALLRAREREQTASAPHAARSDAATP